MPFSANLNRRDFLKAGLLTGGVAAAGAAGRAGVPVGEPPPPTATPHEHGDHGDHGGLGTVGTVDSARNGFDPLAVLQDWDVGQVSTLPDGQTLREYDVYAIDKEIEIAPGVFFPGWVYNGRVPGPTLRCTEGDRVRIEFGNGSSHPAYDALPRHPFGAAMDGVPGAGDGVIQPGGSTVYEFDAFPFGCHLYHCHSPAAEAAYPQGTVRRLHHRPRPGAPSGAARGGQLAPLRLARESSRGTRWSW